MEASFPTEYLGNNTKTKIHEHRFTKPQIMKRINSEKLNINPPYTQLQFKHKIIILMPLRDSLARSLHLTGKATRIPSKRLNKSPIRPGFSPIPIQQGHIIDDVTGYIPRFTLGFPDANPGKTLDPTRSGTVNRRPLPHSYGEIITTPGVKGSIKLVQLKVLVPAPNIAAPIGPSENPLPLGNPVLPLPLVTIPIGPNQSTPPTNHPVPPLPVVLVTVSPHVPPLPLLHVPLPQPLVEVPVGVTLLPVPLLPVGAPGPAVRLALGSGKGPKPLHPTRFEFTLVGGSRRPRELPLPARLPFLPLTLIHTPVSPQILPRSARRVAREAPHVHVTARQPLLHPPATHLRFLLARRHSSVPGFYPVNLSLRRRVWGFAPALLYNFLTHFCGDQRIYNVNSLAPPAHYQ